MYLVHDETSSVVYIRKAEYSHMPNPAVPHAFLSQSIFCPSLPIACPPAFLRSTTITSKFHYHAIIMTTKQLPIYELPPFHLIKLIQPAFQAPSSLTAGASQNVLGVGSPEALNLSAAALSPPPPTGPTSPLNIGTSATINVDNATSTTTLSGRLSQLVGKNVPSSSSPSSSSRPMSPGVAGAAGGFSSSSPSGMTSPELRANRLAPAHGFDSPPSFAFGSNQPVVGGGGSSTARPTSSGRGAQTIRSVEAGAESIWIAGSEGSVAVWKLDADRANAKGKGRAVDAENDSEMLEEVIR